ncbi:hypothetical protein H0H81_001738, partial [Sphagnurus paluster]
PAQSVLEYEVKSFTPGREHKTIYQGLSDEADRAWGELYNHTIMKIPKSEAVLLPNKTYPILDEPGYYLGGLDVFHQLHCLHPSAFLPELREAERLGAVSAGAQVD